MSQIKDLLDIVAKYMDQNGLNQVKKAADFAEESHAGRIRIDGSTYIEHPIAVATILAKWEAPPYIVAAALLHDVLKQKYSNSPSLEAIEDKFGSLIASLVREVARLGRLGSVYTKTPSEKPLTTNKLTSGERLLVAAAVLQQSPEPIVIKIADRLHNLESVDVLPPARRKEFAKTARYIFAPFADRLGMADAKRKLEDKSLSILDNESYQEAESKYQELCANQQMKDLVSRFQQELSAAGIIAEVKLRVEHLFGIHQLLEKESARPTDGEMFSLIAITNSIQDCYCALGVIHSLWAPSHEISDYIAKPKPNGDRALQTHVLHSTLGTFRVHLCTEEMHCIAEEGIIIGKWRCIGAEWLPQLPSLPERPTGHIMVLSPTLDVRYLPKNATPIDFAYALDREIGHRCMSVLINGKPASLNTQLEEGNIVELDLARRGMGPTKEDWLEFVVTDTAKQAIEQWERSKKGMKFTIEARDRVQLVFDISALISFKGFNIKSFSAHAESDGQAYVTIELEGINKKETEHLKKEIELVPNVKDVVLTPIIIPFRSVANSIIQKRNVKNPYTLNVVFGLGFYGRKNDIQNVVDRLRGLERDNALLIWGQKRIGKTSLLLHLESFVLPGSTYRPVFVSMEAISGESTAIFLHRLAFEMAKKIESVSAPTVNEMRQEPMVSFYDFIDKIERVLGPHRLLVILDEFQLLGRLKEEGMTREVLFTTLRDLVQHNITVNFLFSGGGLPSRLLDQAGVKALLSSVDPIRLGPLKKEEARALITQPKESLIYEEAAIEKLLAVTACCPAYIQYLCRNLVNVGRHNDRISVLHVEQVISNTMLWQPRLEPFISHFWQMGLRDTEQAENNKLVLSVVADQARSSEWVTFDTIAAKLYKRIAEQELMTIIRELIEYGSLIKSKELRYKIMLPLLERWFQEAHSF